MTDELNDEGGVSDEFVRLLMERGDMGVSPGEKFPSVYGNSVEAQIWRAAVGNTEKGYLRSLRWSLEQRYPHIYAWKILAESKRGLKKRQADAKARNLTREQFFNLYGAISFANLFGAVLNVHVIVSWKMLGFDDQSEATHALQYRFLKPMKEWYYSKPPDGLPLAWVYSNECSGRIGFHTHILTNIPNELRPEFREWVKRRLSKFSRVDVVPRGAYKIVAPPSDPIGRQWIYFQYLCKGLDPSAVAREAYEDLDEEINVENERVMLSDLIRFEYESPGEVTCKIRAAVSQNIGESERTKYGFKSLLEEGMFDIRSLYSGREYKEWQRQKSLRDLEKWL